ncbi:MAG: iron-containing alcohol dehydrogenase [Thermodesulfobacteriota bacterium]
MKYKDPFNFNFYLPTKIIFGEGALKEITKEMDRLNMRQALVVTDKTLRDSPMIKDLIRHLGARMAGLYAEAIPDSSIPIVNKGAEIFAEIGADALISLGGGSTMDTAKALGILATKKKKDVREFLGFYKVGQPIVPHIAIPTTSGTGSEVTMFTTIKDHESRVKILTADPYLIPPVAILDPLLTVGLSPEMTAATGADALSHAVESFHARAYEPIADGLAAHAIRLINQYLPRCVAKGDDLEARGMQAIASTMAAMAFQNALVGCAHALAHALGGMYGLHHGLANAILLPFGMRFNMPVSAPRYRLVGEAFGLNIRGKSEQEIGELAVTVVEEFIRGLGLPQRLSQVHIPKENLEEVAKLAVTDPAMRSNIRKVTDPQEILPVLLSAW